MKSLLVKIDSIIEPFRVLADRFGTPFLYLFFRLYVAEDFFRSGIGRLRDFLNGRWDTQIFLFEMEHPVPGFDPALAASVTMAGELLLPILVVLGLFTRFGAVGLFIMALVIQITYQAHFQHILWMSMMAVIFIKGPGVLSLDHFLIKWIRKKEEPVTQKV